MIKTILFIFLSILTLGMFACTQKSFEVAPGKAEPTSEVTIHQTNQIPTNPHPLFVEEFYSHDETQTNRTNASTSVTLAPNTGEDQNN